MVSQQRTDPAIPPQIQRALDLLEGVKPDGADSWKALCPAHDDYPEPSLSLRVGDVQPLVVHCFGGCSGAEVLKALNGLGAGGKGSAWRGAIGARKAPRKRAPDPLPSLGSVCGWKERLVGDAEAREYIHGRGITLETINERLIGWNGRSYTLPVFGDHGCLVNLRTYDPTAEPKMRGLYGRGSQLYPVEALSSPDVEHVVVCEGEWDALIVNQYGIPAVAGTAGAATFKEEWAEQFRKKRAWVVYDCDGPGRKGAISAAETLAKHAEGVHVVDLGLTDDGADVTDWFVRYGRSFDDFKALLDDTPDWEPHARPATAKRTTEVEPGASRLIDGASFILDIPDVLPSVWGRDDQILWAAGQGLIICGPQGVGKTTLAQQLVCSLLGINSHLLGYPVVPSEGRVLYLAMDRPQQIAHSFRRMLTEEHRSLLRDRLSFWRGPLPFNIVKDPPALANFLDDAGATVAFADSYKDLAPNLTQDEVGSAVNSAVQEVIARGMQWCGLHHQRKAQSDNRRPNTLDDVYGSNWLTAGMGSVLLLWGKPGSPVVELAHLKQPGAVVGPLNVTHNHSAGESSVRHVDDELMGLLREAGASGVTLKQVAQVMFGAIDRPEKERARRRLQRLADENAVRHVPGATGGKGGGGDGGRWYLA